MSLASPWPASPGKSGVWVGPGLFCFLSPRSFQSAAKSRNRLVPHVSGHKSSLGSSRKLFVVHGADRAEKRLRMRHFRPSRPISFEIAQSARHLARKYRLEQHIPNETLDFAVKFRLVFRYETVVFRRYGLALLLVGLSRKFEAYLVYLTLI